MDNKQNEFFDLVNKRADYALASLSRDLVYEAYGMAKAFYIGHLISYNEFSLLNKKLVVNGLNNYKNVKLR